MSTVQTIACPYCSEEIKATAIKCKHCGETMVDPDELPALLAQRRSTGELTGAPPAQRRGSGDLGQPGQQRRGTGKLRQPAFPPSPLPKWATKKNLLIGGGVVAALGLLMTPKFTFCCLFLGVPSIWVLLDSTWRYKKPSWLAAGLGPAILPLAYYGLKRLLVKPEVQRPVGKRPDGHPSVAVPPTLNAIASLVMIGILMLWWSADPQDRPRATRHLGAPPPPVVSANEETASNHTANNAVNASAPTTATSTREDTASNDGASRSYQALADVISEYNEMTDLQKKKWEGDHENGVWVSGEIAVKAVREKTYGDPFRGDYYVVVSQVGRAGRAILFFDKTLKNEKLVLGLSEGSRVAYKGRLKEIHSGFWSTAYIHIEQ